MTTPQLVISIFVILAAFGVLAWGGRFLPVLARILVVATLIVMLGLAVHGFFRPLDGHYWARRAPNDPYGINFFRFSLPAVTIGAGLFAIGLTWIVQLRRARRRAVLDLLTVAFEKRMPLPPLLEALAADHWAKDGLLNLAYDVEAGMSLGDAIEANADLLPREAVTAARLGETTGDLAAAFRDVGASERLRSPVRLALLGHVSYLVALALFVPLMLGFFNEKIIPIFIMIFDDFSAPLPRLTVWAVRLFYGTWWLGIGLAILCVAALIYAVLCYAEVLPLPTLGSRRRFAQGPVLRAMALAVGAKRPVADAMHTLAQTYPQPATASRLEACARESRAGANWSISLLKHDLIGVHDAALIDAAGRMGNLPWALSEVAEGNDRRLVYRLEAAINVVAPILLVIWGVVVLGIVVACFLPLIELIKAVARWA